MRTLLVLIVPLVSLHATHVEAQRVQISMLVDTSMSMRKFEEATIDRLRAFVEERSPGNDGNVEVELFVYGGEGGILNLTDGFTDAVDTTFGELERRLQRLTGGTEQCGAVLQAAIEEDESEPKWSPVVEDERIIVIVGNESFTQGSPNALVVIQRMRARRGDAPIDVHTMHCGFAREGESTKWRDGATAGGGTYTNIEFRAGG